MRKPMESRIRELAMAILGALVLLAPAGCTRKNANSRAVEESAVQVNAEDVVRIQTRRIESGVAFTGDLAPVQTVEVTSRFDGDLDAVMVREGQAIQRGQAMAKYRPRDVNDRLTAAEAGMLAAQAGLSAAENGARRAKRLFDAGAASSSDLEAAEAQRSAAQAAVDNAVAMRNRAKEDAERLDVPSPITGWVSNVLVHGGDRTAVGDRLFTIVDNSELELSATVPAEALALVRPGATIRFHVDGYPNDVFEGKVDRVNPTTEPGTRQVRIYMRLPNPEGRLVGGLFASGRVLDQVREQALAAPIGTIRKEGQVEVVYRLRGGRAQRLPIRTGLIDSDAGAAELIGDVAAGDSLLTGVLPGLKDGAKVLILKGSQTTGAAPASTDK
jgi:membrane fusion protein (multidrug efflux system)